MLKGIKNKIKQNKIGKLLMAGILSAVVTLTALPITVKADDPTIDFSKKGSITIHKYEYNGNSAGTGTGAQTDVVPNDATPLGGVTFKIKLVYTLDSYYTPAGVALPSVADAQAVTPDTDKTSGTIAAIGDWTTITTATTGDIGTATIGDLPLGIYLVQETAAPSQITGQVADFLVSIPMTNADGTGWLYDVHVYPKNSSTYGNVYLLKQGQIGSGTATALPNAQFKLQRLNTTTSKWETIKDTDNTTDKVFTTDSTTGKEGTIEVNNLAPDKYRFVEIKTTDNTGYIMDGATVYEFEVKTDGKSYITNNIGDEVEVTSAAPITVTNYKPDLVKQVKKADGTWANAADYSVGDTIPYRITLDVPTNVASLGTFTITDTLSNLTLANPTNFKICSDDGCTTEILDGNYSEPSSGVTTWTIAFGTNDNPGIKNYAGQKIYIYYEAKLTDAAVNTSAGNVNTATLTYSHEIKPTDDQNPNVSLTTHTDTISDQAVVYTFKLIVEKVDGDDPNKKLENVEFDLYKADNSGDVTLKDPDTSSPINVTKLNTTSLVTDSNGQISVNGLGNGTYYLVETKTVDNATGQQYNLLKNPVKITINSSYTVNESTTTTTTNGATATATTLANATYANTGTNGVFTQIVKNYTGFLLPATGGVGTVVFVFIGVSMMVAAVILFVISRKKNREEKQ